jgi:hypothetical protein
MKPPLFMQGMGGGSDKEIGENPADGVQGMCRDTIKNRRKSKKFLGIVSLSISLS